MSKSPILAVNKVQSDLNEIVAAIPLPQSEAPGAPTNWNGEQFTIVRGGGCRPQDAIAHWLEQFNAEIQGKEDGMIWWRMRPEIQAARDFATGIPFWQVYSRFVVTTERAHD